MLLLSAAWVCSRREVQSCWRWVVVVSILLADSCNICSDALIPFDNFTPRDKVTATRDPNPDLNLTLTLTLALALALSLTLALALSLALSLT